MIDGVLGEDGAERARAFVRGLWVAASSLWKKPIPLIFTFSKPLYWRDHNSQPKCLTMSVKGSSGLGGNCLTQGS